MLQVMLIMWHGTNRHFCIRQGKAYAAGWLHGHSRQTCSLSGCMGTNISAGSLLCAGD